MANKKSVQLLVIITMFFLMALGVASAFDYARFKGDSFTISYPAEWELATKERIRAMAEGLGAPPEAYKFAVFSDNGANVTIVVGTLPPDEKYIEKASDDELESQIRMAYSQLQDAGIADIQSLKIKRLNGIRCSDAISDLYLMNIPLRQRQIGIFHRGYQYVVTGTAKKGEFDYINSEYFEPMFHSIRLHK